MKFSYSLQFNAVPEWSEEYLSYADMKKAVHDIETAKLEESKGVADPIVASPKDASYVEMGPKSVQLDSDFIAFFESDAERVRNAFLTKKETCFQALTVLFAELTRDQTSEDVSIQLNNIQVWSGDDINLEKRRAQLEDRLNKVYLNLHDLYDFLDLNYTGYIRIVKKYTKSTDASAEKKRELMTIIDSILPVAALSEIQDKIAQVEEVYARVMCDGRLPQARASLHLLVRDRLAVQRSQPVSASPSTDQEIVKSSVAKTESHAAAANAHSTKQPYLNSKRVASLIASVLLFVLLAFSNKFIDFRSTSEDSKDLKNVSEFLHSIFYYSNSRIGLAILLTCTLLWCTEALPLFITAILVPFLVCVFTIIPADKVRPPKESAEYIATVADTAKYFFPKMFSDGVILMIGGFSISRAFDKYMITKSIATVILKKFGKTSSSVLLTIIVLTTVASMFISNVAAPVLCFGLIQPIIKSLDYDNNLARSLILGIAFGANIGGLGSPIASPQNIIGSATLSGTGSSISFVGWLITAAPIWIISVLFTWIWLRYFFPSKETLNIKEIFAPSGNEKKVDRFSAMATVIIAAISISIWIFSAQLKSVLGSMGMMATIPIVGLFGLGLLGKDDFNGFMWNVVILAMGGSALGYALGDAKLLTKVGGLIGLVLENQSPFVYYTVFCFILLLVTTFISHSVGAAIFLPILVETGKKASENCSATLVLLGCFTCSAGMAMPISGFPNMTAAALEDRKGKQYVGTGEFVKGGVVPSIFLCFAIILIGGHLAKIFVPPAATV